MVRRFDGRDPANLRYEWDASASPVFDVRAGEEFEVVLHDSSTGQLGPESSRDALSSLDPGRLDAIAGPILVEGARPGDALDVELLAVQPASWGWSGVFREFGFLRHRFDDDLVIWQVGEEAARPVRGFLRPVEVPTSPMLGVIGVAPAAGRAPLIPPGPFGGNLDHRAHRAGATVRFPVFQPGALLSLADPHAAQGDGEVCGTGIEVPATVRIRLTLRPGEAPPGPRVVSRFPAARAGEPVWSALGTADDLEDATERALDNLLDWLETGGWSRKEGYLLASVVGNLRIAQVVDLPNFTVAIDFPAGLGHPPGRGPAD